MWFAILAGFPRIEFDSKVAGGVALLLWIVGVCAFWIDIRRTRLLVSVRGSLAYEGFLCGAATAVIMSGNVRVVENLGVAITVLCILDLLLGDNETM